MTPKHVDFCWQFAIFRVLIYSTTVLYINILNCCFRHLRGLIFFPIRNFTAQVSKIRKEPVNNNHFMIVTVWHYKGQLICSLSLKHKHLAYLCLPWPELWAVTKATFSTVVTASQPSFARVFPPQLLNMWSFPSFLFSSPLLWESLKFDKLRESQPLRTLFRWICWMLMIRGKKITMKTGYLEALNCAYSFSIREFSMEQIGNNFKYYHSLLGQNIWKAM